jgi:hypothetical protein
LFEKYKDKLNCWNWSSGNSSLPWSIDLIEKYRDKWDWEWLSNNLFLPWSIELIEKYKDKWNWKYDSINVYIKVFQSYLTDSFVEEIMSKITLANQ